MPKGIGYGPNAKKKAAKKAVKKINESNKSAVSKRHGKVVQKQVSPTKTIGYATTTRTTLPKSRTRKVGRGASMQAKKSQRRAKR